jgi:hypothetical protein
MTTDATIEIVSSSLGEGSSDESDRDGPARLMRPDDTTDLDTEEYPEVTAHVNVESTDGAINDVGREHFSVTEDGEAREVISFDYLSDALDLVFVFDDTGSMGSEIDGAKAGVTDLTDKIDKTGVDARYALVSFKDDVEIDQRFTKRAGSLKSSVDALRAGGGGDTPEANFDAIERALDLNWRTNAQQVIVDITDAASHYRGDGSGFSEYTFEEVARDLQKADVTFISVGPDRENRKSSLKSLAGEVGGLWTDIGDLRSGVFSSGTGSENFQRVLNRITSLVASTYVLTYFSCTKPGTTADTKITFDAPGYQIASDTASVSVPGHFELHPDCTAGGDRVPQPDSKKEDDGPAVKKLEASETGDNDPPSVAAVDDGDDGGSDTPGVVRTDEESDEDLTSLAVITDDHVSAGSRLQVTIRDETGARVENATVAAAGETATTDSRGQCQFTFDTPGEVTITVKKDKGYQSDSKQINVE